MNNDRIDVTHTEQLVSVAIPFTPAELAPLAVKLAKAASILRGSCDADLSRVWKAVDLLAMFADTLADQARRERLEAATAARPRRKRRPHEHGTGKRNGRAPR